MNFNKDVSETVSKMIVELEPQFGGKVPMNVLMQKAEEQNNIQAIDVGIALDFLIKDKKIFEVSSGCFSTKEGDIMNEKNYQTQSTQKVVLTKEQAGFKNLVCKNKGRIYDAQEEQPFLTHRGVQIAFGGCGEKAFRYKVALDLGFSDKEPVEIKVFYLDWDDSALYDEGGIADQLRSFLGTPVPQQEVSLKPVKIDIGGK